MYGCLGVAILSDDIAEDIKLLYKDLLANEYSNEEASRIVIEEYKNELDDERLLFWVGIFFYTMEVRETQENVKQNCK